jgi:hypothetical protein
MIVDDEMGWNGDDNERAAMGMIWVIGAERNLFIQLVVKLMRME